MSSRWRRTTPRSARRRWRMPRRLIRAHRKSTDLGEKKRPDTAQLREFSLRPPLRAIYSGPTFCTAVPRSLRAFMRLYPKVIPIISREVVQQLMQDGDVEVE